MLRVLSAASKRVRPVPRAVALRSSGKGLAAATHFAIRSQPHSFAFPVVSTPFRQLHKSSAAFSVNPTTAELNFTHAISSLYRKIILGLEGMREVNPELDVKMESPTDLQIILGSRGTYQFQAELQDQSLYMLSPLSGTHIYKFDPENNWWTCTKDRHILFDLLTRELMKVCQGYPTL